MSNTILSIIIPVYQTENYLDECLHAVLKSMPQTHKVEVLLVDDGSKDGSGDICRSYAENYPFIKYVPKKNEGVSKTRNLGVKIAEGKYVHFLDSDDFLHSDFLTTAVRCIEDQEFDVCFFEYEDLAQEQNNFTVVRSERKALFSSINADKGINILRRLVSSRIHLSNVWSAIYRRDFLLTNHISFEVGFTSSEDVDFINQCLLHADKVIYQNKTSVIYRRFRADSATNTYDNNKILCDLKVRSKWFNLAKQLDLQPIEYYANEFLDFLFLAEKNTDSFTDVVQYLKKNAYILRYATNKKVYLLKFLICFLGYKNGLSAAIEIINIKRCLR